MKIAARYQPRRNRIGLRLTFLFISAILILLFLGCSDKATGPDQSAPKIDAILVSPDFILPGGTLELSASASDPDGDPIRYRWVTYPRVGHFANDTMPNTEFFFADFLRSGMSIKFTLTVSDGKDSTACDHWVTIDTGKSILGHAYFNGTKVAVPGTGVTVGNRADTTDSDGFFEFHDLYTGQYTLEAGREGFNLYTENINLNDNKVNDLFLVSQAYSGTVSGYIRTKEGTPLEKVRVTMLNPDGTNSQISGESNLYGYYALPQIPTGNRRLLIEDGGNGDYDILLELHDILLMGPSLNYDITAKVRRLAFVSNGAQSGDLWEYTDDAVFSPWTIDLSNDCLRFDFCTAQDLGRLAMKSAIAVPTAAGAVYWAIDIELNEAACEIVVHVDGAQSSGGIYWGGTKHYNINEPIRIPEEYQAGHNILVEFYAWPLKTGTCGDIRLNYFRLDYLE